MLEKLHDKLLDTYLKMRAAETRLESMKNYKKAKTLKQTKTITTKEIWNGVVVNIHQQYEY